MKKKEILNWLMDEGWTVQKEIIDKKMTKENNKDFWRGYRFACAVIENVLRNDNYKEFRIVKKNFTKSGKKK